MQQTAIIIVTYNSEKHMDKCIECIKAQTIAPEQIILVDSGSRDLEYLQKYLHIPGVELVMAGQDAGFCRGNNVGLTKVKSTVDYVLFLNPDAFLTPQFLEKGVDFFCEAKNVSCGAITGTTLGYSMEEDRPTGLYDTTGIFHHWWGKWFDRAQGKPHDANDFCETESIPAICGAVFFCRRSALQSVKLQNEDHFDSSFFMYKEDIDLSLRLRKEGWKLMFVPDLVAYHCRGWNPNRKAMPKKFRLCSAINELKIHWRLRKPLPIAYSVFKYCLVRWLNA